MARPRDPWTLATCSHSLATDAAAAVAASLVDLVLPLHDGDKMGVDIVPVALKLIEVCVGVDDEFFQVTP